MGTDIIRQLNNNQNTNTGAINILQLPCTGISIAADSTSAYIGDMIKITASTTPITETYQVDFRVNGSLLDILNTSSGTCYTYWDTRGKTAGEYVLSANIGTSCVSIPPILITLLPACTTMNIVPSKSTVYLEETVILNITVDPASQSYPVQVRDQNNNLIGECTTSGGTCAINWDTTGFIAGTYNLSMTAGNCTPITPLPIVLYPKCTEISLSANKTSAYIGEIVIFTIITQPSTQPYTVELDLPNQSLPYRSCTTSGGTCTVEWNTADLTTGTYDITASITGQCTSTPLTMTLTPSCTSVNMTTDKVSGSIGETITFNVAVSPTSQSYPVRISDQHNNTIGECTTSGGTCGINWNTTGLNAEIYTMTARVVIGDFVLCGQSSSIDINLTPACTSITISADKTSLYVGEMVTLTVVTQPSTQPYIVGFKDQNNNVLGNCTTNGGTCSFVWDTRLSNSGTYTITAYIPSSTQCSTSKDIILMPACTLVDITSDKTTANIGESIIFNASVNPILQSFRVQLMDQDKNSIGNVCTTSNGTCSTTWDTTGLTTKSYTITAKVIDGVADQCISTPITITLQEPPKMSGSDMTIITIAGLTAAAIYVAKYKK